jgi:uncharacterized repeat protein (TIGR01451 family)
MKRKLHGCKYVGAAAVLFIFTSTSLGVVTADFSSRDYPVGHMPILVVVHDFNADKKPDLAVLNTGSGNVSVLLGNGDGTFQVAKSFSVGGVNPTSISVADFNGDGKVDLAIGFASTMNFSCNGASVSILLGNGDGTFQSAQQVATVPSYYDLVAAGDVNADGKPDLVVQRTQFDSSCSPASGFSVFLGNGDDTFQPGKDIAGPPFDVNSDGVPDIFDTHGYAGPLNIFLGQGSGKYKPLASGPEGNVGLFTVGDLNNDQQQDQVFDASVPCVGLFCQGGTTYLGVALGNGDGTFQPTQRYPSVGYPFPGSEITDIGLGDFNGDGNLDAAFIHFGSSQISILLGKGDGTVPTLLTFDSGSGEGSFVVADLNGDGKPDVVTTNLNDDTVSVVLNTFPSSGADLSVQVTAIPEPVSATQSLTYTVALQNLGPQNATNVVLRDTLPTSVTFGSVAISQGSCTEAQLVVVCNISKLISGDTAVATIAVTPTATGTISNSANATATETDPNSANNSESHSTRVDPMFKLTVTKSGAGTGTVVSGNGINCGSVCTVSLPTGTQLNIQAIPGPNSGFGGWGGACAQGLTAPGCDLTMISDQMVTAEFDTLPNFAFSLTFSSVTVQPGKTDAEAVTLYPEGASFSNPIALTCSVQGPSPAPACSLSPNSVTLPDTNGAASTLTITTTAPHAELVTPSRRNGPLYAFFLPLVGVTFIGIRFGKSNPRRMQALLLGALVCTVVMVQTSCGGTAGSQQHLVGGTPPGNYTIMITGTSGSVQHSTTVSLTVQ